jgi:hypothetical protein
MNQMPRYYFIILILVALFSYPVAGSGSGSDGKEPGKAEICKPELNNLKVIELGHSGNFSWLCSEQQGRGAGYYIVFIRPTGTYILLKVPIGKNFFEFTPDATGAWRWMVINTDPDRSKPDVESDPGYFQVINSEQ